MTKVEFKVDGIKGAVFSSGYCVFGTMTFDITGAYNVSPELADAIAKAVSKGGFQFGIKVN